MNKIEVSGCQVYTNTHKAEENLLHDRVESGLYLGSQRCLYRLSRLQMSSVHTTNRTSLGEKSFFLAREQTVTATLGGDNCDVI